MLTVTVILAPRTREGGGTLNLRIQSHTFFCLNLIYFKYNYCSTFSHVRNLKIVNHAFLLYLQLLVGRPPLWTPDCIVFELKDHTENMGSVGGNTPRTPLRAISPPPPGQYRTKALDYKAPPEAKLVQELALELDGAGIGPQAGGGGPEAGTRGGVGGGTGSPTL